MPYYRVKTDTGYCGTDEHHYVEAESEADAEEVGWDYLQGMISVEVEEITEEEYEEES